MFLSYEKLKENHDVIKELCTKYRKELTEYQAWLAETATLCSSEDYKKLVDEWTLDEFVGNLMSGLTDYNSIIMYRNVLDGKQTIDEFISEQKKKIKIFSNLF